MSFISLIVVIYNRSVSEVPVINAALDSALDFEIVLCDNSNVSNRNEEISRSLDVIYVDMKGNKGLSAAYRAGIKCSHGDIVCLFDDDTYVDDAYFHRVRMLSSTDSNWDLALPLVLCGDRILSPCRFNGYRASQFSDEEQIRSCSLLSGINSGMIVKRAMLDIVQHNQELFLDLIDHKFIDDVRTAGGKIIFLEGPILRQEYSFQSDDMHSALRRFRIFERDARTFYNSSPAHRLYCKVMLTIRKLKLCCKYRSIRFLLKN